MGLYVQGVTLWRRTSNGSWGQVASGLVGDDGGTEVSLQRGAGNGWPALTLGEEYRLDFGGGDVRTMRLRSDDGTTISFG